MKRKCYLNLSIILLLPFLTSCNNKQVEFLNKEAQSGIITANVNKEKNVTLNNKSLKTYKSIKDDVILKFETYHVDPGFNNKVIINDKYEYDLIPSNYSFKTYYETSINLLGLNVIDGQMKVKFIAGSDKTNIALDTFYIRNVTLNIKDNEIWSKEYRKDYFFNEKIGMGEDDINSDLRFNVLSEREFTFNVDEALLDCQGTLISNEDLESEKLNFKIDDKEYIYESPKAKYSINLKDNELINEDRIIELKDSKNIKEAVALMDGVEVKLPLHLTSSCWVSGKHNLKITTLNNINEKETKEFNFELKDNGLPTTSSLKYVTYNNGVANKLPSYNMDLGVKVNNDKEVITPFSKTPFVNFEISDNKSGNLVWTGRANKNRMAFLQLYNYVEQNYDTVATKFVSDSNTNINLAYNYSNQPEYLNNGKTIARVSTINVQTNYKDYDALWHHLSDIQYIVQHSAVHGDSVLGVHAKNCLKSMSDYVVKENPDYAWISGDLTQKTVVEQEWIDLMEYVVDPILKGNIPLGISSGNHDVGGLIAQNPNGSDGLDEVLNYDYYSKYVGEAKFKDLPYYGESFEDNRSHYDTLNICGIDFLFLHLGWGSSIKGVHVSKKDIDWAKNILASHPNEHVILSTHDYLHDSGLKNPTGLYVFNELVKPFKNIKMVMTGHINGCSKCHDFIDDDNDGIKDREVVQVLTNFQEEENLDGASFIRTIKLYKDNNNMLLDLYSPFFNDNDITVFKNYDIVRDTSRFEFAYDLSNDGFGIITNSLK